MSHRTLQTLSRSGYGACLERIGFELPLNPSPSSSTQHHVTVASPSRKKRDAADEFPPSPRHALPRVLHHRTKQEMVASVAVPEPDPHGPMRAIEQRHTSTSSSGNASSSDYDDASLICHLAGQGRLDRRRAELIRLLRRHNYSLPSLVGQAINAQVLRVGKDFVYVDPGFYGIRWV